MIQDYEKGSGIHGAAKSLIGERIVAVLFTENTINVFFESRSAFTIRAYDRGAVVMQPLNRDDTPAYVKTLIRDTDKRQADLDLIISRLTDCKSSSAEGHRDCYVDTDVKKDWA